MKRFLLILKRIFIFSLLTILTQVGGIIYLINIVVHRFWKNGFRGSKIVTFVFLYLVFTFIIIPPIAPLAGREKVKNLDNVKPASFITALCNRNYVQPELNDLLKEVGSDMKKHGITVLYLDANFPFLNKFPMIPHLSHYDGKKIDLCFVYEDNGVFSEKCKSVSGYGVFEEPRPHEFNQTKNCLAKGYNHYTLNQYTSFGAINNHLTFSEKGSKILLQSILNNHKTGKVFVEPHLSHRMNLSHSKIRFQGCHSVRHDDHIHLQLK